MLARETPFRVAMPRYIQNWRCFTHLNLYPPWSIHTSTPSSWLVGPPPWPAGASLAPTWPATFLDGLLAAACASFQHSLAMAQSSSARITRTRTRDPAVDISASRVGNLFA